MKILLFVFSLIAVAALAPAQSTTLRPAAAAKIDQLIPQLMESAGIPGLSIAIVQDDRIVYKRAFGKRNADTGEAVGPQTVFAAASLSKALFAYGLMRTRWTRRTKTQKRSPIAC